VGFVLSLKIEEDKSAFTYVDGGQVSLNSPSLKYESAVSVSGPGAENDYQGSRVSQNGIFVGPNGGSENEATSSLNADGLIAPIVNAKEKLVINNNGFYVQADQPASPSDGDLWINPEAASQVWDVANRVTDVASEAAAIAGDVSSLQFLLSTRPLSHNYVLNSDFEIWQRGTASLTFGATRYTADRLRAGRTSSVAGGTVTRSTVVPDYFGGNGGANFSIQVRRDTGNTSTAGLILTQPFETAGKQLRGKTVTLSFDAMCGANYSAASNELVFGLQSSSVSPEAVAYASGGLFSSGNADTFTLDSAAYLSTDYSRYSMVFYNLPETTDAFQVYFRHNPTGTAGSEDFFRIANVQLEIGETATDYKRNSPNAQAELAACQRFYARTANQIDFGYQTDTNGFGAANFIGFPTEMRAIPTITTVFGNYDNSAAPQVASVVPSGFVIRSARVNSGFAYFRYGITYTATAEI
jgi:hypothetical protein